MPHRLVCLLGLLLLLPVDAALAASILTGEVVAVADGDSLTLLTPERRQVKVRLAEIDAPERGQAYGRRAHQALAAKVFGREARVEVQTLDRYRRSVGRVYVDGRDINAEMISEGHAWVYPQYLRDRRLPALESRARAFRAGLWALPEAERRPPWEWRRIRRTAAPPAPAPAPARHDRTTPPFTCAGKRTCREMSSCAEARYYLIRCGLAGLDADGDGVPCQTLCR